MNHWVIENHFITNTFTFSGFNEAMDFMFRAQWIISDMNHHPEWTNRYNTVHIKLCTHDAGDKVTQKDWDLALALNQLYQKMNGAET
jgi:4a-hydroxytetrahydrobiopterin dehydratase